MVLTCCIILFEEDCFLGKMDFSDALVETKEGALKFFSTFWDCAIAARFSMNGIFEQCGAVDLKL